MKTRSFANENLSYELPLFSTWSSIYKVEEDDNVMIAKRMLVYVVSGLILTALPARTALIGGRPGGACRGAWPHLTNHRRSCDLSVLSAACRDADAPHLTAGVRASLCRPHGRSHVCRMILVPC